MNEDVVKKNFVSLNLNKNKFYKNKETKKEKNLNKIRCKHVTPTDCKFLLSVMQISFIW